MIAISFRQIIPHAVWLCLRFSLSYRDVEGLLVQRRLDASGSAPLAFDRG
jgi:transposase-like protein